MVSKEVTDVSLHGNDYKRLMDCISRLSKLAIPMYMYVPVLYLWLFFCIKHFQIHEIITSVTPVNTTRFVNNCIYIYWVLQVFPSHFISFRLTTYWLIISLSCRTWLHYWEYRMQRLHGCTLHFQIDAVYYLNIYIYRMVGWSFQLTGWH